MYSLYGQSGSSSLPSGDGVVEDAMVVDQGSSVNLQELHNRHQYHYNQDGQYNLEVSSRSDREREARQGHSQENEQLPDFEEFLYCRAGTSRDMVAQDMEQSYDQLFHMGQEPQEFMSLEEFGPHAHQDHRFQALRVSTSNTTAHLYPGNQNQQNPGVQQQRTYYNLSSAAQDSCAAVYFGNIGESSGVGELGSLAVAGEALPPAPTPSQSSNNVSPAGKGTAETSTATIIGSCSSIGRNSKNNARRKKNNKIEAVDENRNNSQGVTQGIEMAPHMETISAMLPEQGSASGHHYNHQHRHHPDLHHHHHCSDVEATPSHGIPSEHSDDFTPVSRKRKVSCHDDNNLPEETGEDVKSTRANTDNKKQNHSEIEKRRRDKMNTYITELSAMVPMCNAMSRKLDKLTVLRMAVQHLKTILGAGTSYTEGHYKPSFLNDQELKTLILQAAEGFVFVVGCARGKILYVSESVSQTLNYTQNDLLGQSWFDILHPKDVATAKEQLSSPDLSPRERLIDAKTMLPVKTDVPHGVSKLCPGARRSFFCRMKRKVDTSECGVESQVKEETETTTGCHRRKKQQNVDWKYCVIHCTGYLKSWAPEKMEIEPQEGDADGDGEGCNVSCLVAVGRVQPELPVLPSGPSIPKLRTIEFVSRHATDGKFLFVDQSATLVLGFLPQELLGTNMYEYYHHDDIPHLADSHKAALQSPERVMTRIYRFRTKDANFVKLQSEWKSFRNPWTKEIESLISKNSAVYCDTRQAESSISRAEGCSVQGNYDYFAQSKGGLERLISSHVETSKIGRKIAEQVFDQNQRRSEDSCSVSSQNPAPDQASFNTEFQITTTVPPENVCNIPQTMDFCSDNIGTSNQSLAYNQIRNNVQLNSIANDQGAQSDEDMMEIIGGTTLSESSNPLASDGNDEAAMAVIMSLLEADAGLGGPVDFSGLPWPLP